MEPLNWKEAKEQVRRAHERGGFWPLWKLVQQLIKDAYVRGQQSVKERRPS